MTTDFKQMLEKMDLGEIDKLRQAKQAITYLQGRRKELQDQIAVIDEQISGVSSGTVDPNEILPRKSHQLSSNKTSIPRGRRKEGMSLPSKIIEVLQGKTEGMTVPQISSAVVAIGYQTSSKTLPNQVLNSLMKMPEVERISRGVYRLKVG